MLFMVQIGDTKPDNWETVNASSRGYAAALVAAKAGPGTHAVYVSMGCDRHPNGAPVVVERYSVEVAPRTETASLAEVAL